MYMKYNIIYADPPRSYKVWSKKWKWRSAESHYNTMSKEDIQNIDINSMADDNCVLFLRVTYPTLEEWLELIKKRWFTYKTCAFSRVKRNKKSNSRFWWMWYWTRANNEICLLATKWNPKRVSAWVHQIIDEPIREHSRKPDIVRDKIVELMWDLPRIELFARSKTPWRDVRWNEVDKF